MVDKLIATVNIRDDDDRVSSFVEVVDTGSKCDGPVRVREFVSGAPHGFYRTWHFDGRVEAMSYALSLAGFGPLADDGKDKTADPELERLLAEEEKR